ncbi:MAG TPA: hypothetical protein VNJ04_00820 [Gemmatimonadaceae bacterium]|nr:hypothetical protein [Gemmatimonadaceae bacterium]
MILSIDRDLELFDLTGGDEFCALFRGDGEPKGEVAPLSRYYLYFAFAARCSPGDR